MARKSVCLLFAVLMVFGCCVAEKKEPKIGKYNFNYKPQIDESNNPLIIKRHENLQPGVLLEDVSQYVTDEENDKLTYSLDRAGEEVCQIGGEDGKLRLKIQTDREQKTQYRFKVIVADEGVNRGVAMDVYLFIQDENDNKPIFQNTPYHVDVAEDTKVGKEFLKISASDNDAPGANSDIRYIFKEGHEYPNFKLDPNTGVLSLVQKLDYEIKTSYTLEVVAQDSGTPALAEETKVVVNIIDVDDMKPYFVIHHYEKEIKENLPVGTSIAIVSAKDGDKSINAEINYKIISGDEYGLFQIDKKNGNVTVRGELNREYYTSFTLSIKAYEVQNEESFSTINLYIKLTDENDNKPTFKKDHYYIKITSDQLYPKTIISEAIKAVDEDAMWKNNIFEYWTDEKYFEVLPESGTLVVKKDLRKEKENHFQFYVYAREKETAEKYTGKTRVTVDILRNEIGKSVGNVLSSSWTINPKNTLLLLSFVCIFFTRHLYP